MIYWVSRRDLEDKPTINLKKRKTVVRSVTGIRKEKVENAEFLSKKMRWEMVDSRIFQ